MPARHLPYALDQTIGELGLTREGFAELIGISTSMVAKLLRGERAHESTYLKLFGHFKRGFKTDAEPAVKRMAAGLLRAHFQDLKDTFGLGDDQGDVVDASVHIGSEADLLLSGMFRDLPDPVVLALYAVGRSARGHDNIYNALMTLAELSGGTGSTGGSGFPAGYFTRNLHKPREPASFIGGSLGAIVMGLMRRHLGPEPLQDDGGDDAD